MTAPGSTPRKVSDALHRAFLARLDAEPEITRKVALEALDRALLTATDTTAADLRAWKLALANNDIAVIRAWCVGDDEDAVRMRAPGIVLDALPRSIMRRVSLQNGGDVDVRDRWIGMDYCFIADQIEGETPNRWYALYRYLDRLFEPKRRPNRDDEIETIDLAQMSHRARYLMRHTLILKGAYKDALNRYPNLRGLHAPELRPIIDEPIVLTDPPQHPWSYFRKKNIWL